MDVSDCCRQELVRKFNLLDTDTYYWTCSLCEKPCGTVAIGFCPCGGDADEYGVCPDCK